MSCKLTLCGTLTVVIAISMATPLFAQYQVYPTSLVEQQQYVVGSGAPNMDPAQQVTPGPSYNSFYDQPTPNDESIDDKYSGRGDVWVKSFAAPARGGWYAGAAGLIMTRDHENTLWLSYDQVDLRERVLTSRDADFSYDGGVQARLGHYFNCGRNSIEISYWGIYPGQSEANAFGADTVVGLDTILHFDDLRYDAGAGGGAQDLSGTFFFSADRHRLQRSYEAHNIELNLLGHNFTNGCGPVQLGWTAGVRYLRFDEDFLYSSDVVDTVFTGAPEEVHYGIDVENNLIGFQLGGRGDYCLGRGRFKLFADVKTGIFGNDISHHSRIFGAAGQAVVNPAGGSPFAGQDFNIASNKTDVAFIGDLSLGATWCLNPCWRLNAGYRAVGVSGVALATNQVPNDFIAVLDSSRWVDSNGSLILHGAFFGVEYSR